MGWLQGDGGLGVKPRWAGDACTCVGYFGWCQPCLNAMQRKCQGAEANSSAISDLGSDKALLDRANEVARQAWEIADQRAQRIAELETEVAALTDTLKTLFKSAAQSPDIPADAVEFPVNALKWSV